MAIAFHTNHMKWLVPWLAPQTIHEQLKKISDIKGFQAEGNSKQKNGAFVGDKEALG